MLKLFSTHSQAWLWTILLGLGLLCGCGSADVPPGGQATRVERVLSGQTLEVDQLLTSVRLLGIDAPDLQQKPWGPAARDYLRELVSDRTVVLEVMPTMDSTSSSSVDPYGRTFAYLWCDGKLVNAQLVEAGYALVRAERSPNPKRTQLLIRAQEKARLMGVGIWNPAQPMRQTPQEFRKQNQ